MTTYHTLVHSLQTNVIAIDYKDMSQKVNIDVRLHIIEMYTLVLRYHIGEQSRLANAHHLLS